MSEEQDNYEYHDSLKRDTLEGLELMPTYIKISQILLLQYDEFVCLIDKFNQVLKSVTEGEADFIEFSIEPESDTTMFWKLFIRIKCSRISRANRRVTDKTILTLNQFLSVYQSLTQQLLLLEENPTNNLYNSAITQNSYSSVSTTRLTFPVFDTNECCICMDRSSNLVLSCTHKLCDECFKQWTTETSATGYQTCPICRTDLNIDSDFLLVEKPESNVVKKNIVESVLGLPDDNKTD